MINDRQFFITQNPNSTFASWKVITLQKGYTLHYHEGLNIVYKDENIVLLGYAWQVDPNRKSPQEELFALGQKGKISHEEVYEIEKTWCGRYLLIVGEWIYLDTCGTLGVFYNDQIVTSSINVLCVLDGRKIIYPEITHRKMPDFVPGMRTQYADVFRLLPSQLLNYITKETKIRPLLIDKSPNFISEDDRINNLSLYFINSVQNFSRLFPSHRLWVAITGGRDSRTTLAYFEKAQVEYSTFTLWHGNITDQDRIIPKKLAKAIHRTHKYITRDELQFSKKRHDDYKIHTAGMAVDEDWQFYAYNQYQNLIEDDEPIVILRSSIWAIPNDFYTMCYGEKSKELSIIYPGIKDNELFYKSSMEWKEYVERDELNSSISFANRTLWDIREGCWLSSIEQSFDMMDGITSIQIANCRLFLTLLFGFEAKDRIRKVHEDRIASVVCPEFASIPYDYQFETVKQKIRRYKHYCKNVLKSILRKDQ